MYTSSPFHKLLYVPIGTLPDKPAVPPVIVSRQRDVPRRAPTCEGSEVSLFSVNAYLALYMLVTDVVG